MRAQDLSLASLLTHDDASGVLDFAGERALLLNAAALGLLRAELVQTIGVTGARGILTRFGYAHGWKTAESLRNYPWETEREWRVAGGRLHHLQGMVSVEPLVRDPKSGPAPFAEAIWRESYEAEQHLLHHGQSDVGVCWTLTGFASGYLSFCNGRPIYCLEERCRAKGDAVCHVVGKSADEWGDAITEHLPFYRNECLEVRLKQVTGALKRAERKLKQRERALSRPVMHSEENGLVAKSNAMQKVVQVARRVAKVDTTVLLMGESGVGKERVARLIHEQSERMGGPFVALNCGAVTESLLESELFGHVRGAFTGATQDRPGLFEAAAGGTLFLDEVGELSPGMQVKLLRVLQERVTRRVGENKDRAVNVRVVAATNRKLEDEVKNGAFRMDLYYRLRVVELVLPPLRERRDDILTLARVLLAEIGARTGKTMRSISTEAATLLLKYDWPGNVRELANTLERALVLSESTRLEADDLPDELRAAESSAVAAQDGSLAEVERAHILSVLEKSGGNQQRAAAQLGIGTATLYRKLQRYRRQRPGKLA